jgi:hypothetical protein
MRGQQEARDEIQDIKGHCNLPQGTIFGCCVEVFNQLNFTAFFSAIAACKISPLTAPQFSTDLVEQ